MRHNQFRAATVALAAIVVHSGFAQEAAQPIENPKRQWVVERFRVQPPVTEANIDEVIQSALEMAKNGDFEAYTDPKRIGPANDLEQRLVDYPYVSLKRLALHAKDTDDKVRSLVESVASRVLHDREVPELHTDALSLLTQVALVPAKPGQNVSQTSALNELHARLFAESRKEREAMRQKVDMAALKAALISYLDLSYADSAVLLLTLFASDATLKPFVDKITVREDYSTSALVLQAAWGAGNAIGALKQKLEIGEPEAFKFLATNILAINEPNTLRALWQQLDNKKEMGEHPVGNPNGDWKMAHPRACDFVLAVFRWKFDGDPNGENFSHFPIVATDAQLAAAKARYHDIIAALPQIGEQVGSAFEPF